MSARQGLSIIAATAAGLGFVGCHTSKEYGFEVGCSGGGELIVNSADDHGIDVDCRDQQRLDRGIGITAVNIVDVSSAESNNNGIIVNNSRPESRGEPPRPGVRLQRDKDGSILAVEFVPNGDDFFSDYTFRGKDVELSGSHK